MEMITTPRLVAALRFTAKLAICLAAIGTFSLSASACDESCRKEKAQARYGEKFPSYLSRAYCEEIKIEFMTSTLSSLQSYRDTRLDVKRKRGMNNTRSFIDQRKAWLQECDNYLTKTDHGRIFKDDKTTVSIFNAMDSVSRELSSLVKGVTYSFDHGQDSTVMATEKFDHLFELVDNHKTLLLLKGQFVLQER